MSDVPLRFDHIRTASRVGRLLVYLGVGGLIIVAGYRLTGEVGPWPWFGRHLLSFGILSGLCLVVALFVYLWYLVNLLLKVEGNSFRSYGVLRDLYAAVEKNESHLRIVADNVQMSDAVRAIMHRTRERTALRMAINEEIVRGDWEAAYALVDQLQQRHGYANESARLRTEVDRSRQLDRAERLHDTVEKVKHFMESQDWERARLSMDRLMAEHPANRDVQELPKFFARARNDHKRRLLKEWDQAVQRNDVDRGIALLRDLDQYLTPNEAAALEESARGVFRAKLHNLGVRFSIAVTSHKWREAINAGEEIIKEFPNTRMAGEVRDRMHLLAKKAEQEGAPGDEVESVSE
ncbi:MAG TPA: hypothetical protein VNT79_03890 [Phycisphaerae bacterium]|nr:hypothetical protein [Phycisphaerae bacterium]